MGAKKTSATSGVQRKQRPAMSEEARENQLIALAVDCVEKRLRENTASAAEVCHYLKMGSPKERLAREREKEEIKLLKAKTEAIESEKDIKELYAKALNAMRRYQGDTIEDD